MSDVICELIHPQHEAAPCLLLRPCLLVSYTESLPYTHEGILQAPQHVRAVF